MHIALQLFWPTFIIALLVWGFAPGGVLRLIVLAFHRDDPRRAELRAELYAVPRIERPFWVVEHLEVALVEGLGERLVWAATGRIIGRWNLGSGVRRNREHPDSFYIPSEEEWNAVVAGVDVKLMFEMRDGWGERMWVTVTAVKRRKLIGRLNNLPLGIPRLIAGDKIKFRRDHVIDIWEELGPAVGCSADHTPRPSVQPIHGGCNGHGKGHGKPMPDTAPPTSLPPSPPPPPNPPARRALASDRWVRSRATARRVSVDAAWTSDRDEERSWQNRPSDE